MSRAAGLVNFLPRYDLLRLAHINRRWETGRRYVSFYFFVNDFRQQTRHKFSRRPPRFTYAFSAKRSDEYFPANISSSSAGWLHPGTPYEVQNALHFFSDGFPCKSRWGGGKGVLPPHYRAEEISQKKINSRSYDILNLPKKTFGIRGLAIK